MAKGSRKLTTERNRNVGGRGKKSKRVRGEMQQKRRKIQIKIHMGKMIQKYPMVCFSEKQNEYYGAETDTKNNKMDFHTM